jgi:hypothetical protein
MTALGIEVLSRYVPQAWQAAFRESARQEKVLGRRSCSDDTADPVFFSVAPPAVPDCASQSPGLRLAQSPKLPTTNSSRLCLFNTTMS